MKPEAWTPPIGKATALTDSSHNFVRLASAPALNPLADAALGLPAYLGERRTERPDKESNWLPAPEGGFRPTLRMYQPGAAVLDGSWLPPSIKRLD